MIAIVRDESAAEFLRHASDLLYAEEPLNSLMIGLCEFLATQSAPPIFTPLFLRVVKHQRTVAAVVQTRAENIVITRADDDAIEALVDYLSRSHTKFAGVVGFSDASTKFGERWALLTGKRLRLGMGQRIYRLDTVVPPARPVPGHLRLATGAELDTLIDWIIAFTRESLLPAEHFDLAQGKQWAETWLARGALHVWVDADGVPVSMATCSRSTRHGISVNAVYTPKVFRRHGYASALVAAVSQKQLDLGKDFCVLYTDLANPTSNKIYQDVGYREVADSKHFLFE